MATFGIRYYLPRFQNDIRSQRTLRTNNDNPTMTHYNSDDNQGHRPDQTEGSMKIFTLCILAILIIALCALIF